MIVTTTPYIEGAKVSEYKGIVTGEAIVGANLFRDFFAGVRDLVGGRSKAYEKELEKGRNIAVNEMVEKAAQTGANAVIGVDFDYETVGKNGSMLMITVSGTSVVTQ